MITFRVRFFLLTLTILFFAGTIKAQEPIDKIIAKVGGSIILKSDVEAQYIQSLAQGVSNRTDLKCHILENLLVQKILLNQAQLDSLTVGDDRVEDEMNRRLRYFVAQIGSQEKLEEYLGKSVVEFKDELREQIRDLMMAQQMQQEITKSTNVTPSEVRDFFNTVPEDSLPFFNTEIEVAQIIKYAEYSKAAKQAARDKLEELRARVAKGESFATLAILYSQDPGSAKQGGELGFVSRGDLVKAFESVAFKLKPGELSDIVETEYGFHILQLMERRGEQINVRHILIKPILDGNDLLTARNFLDSIYYEILSDKITFAEAAEKYSDDKATKNNGGSFINQIDGSVKIPMDQLDPSVSFVMDTLKKGNISKPAFTQSPSGNQGYRLIYFKSQTEPHKANLKEDYQKIQQLALQKKQEKIVATWFNKKQKETYLRIDDEYRDCKNLASWFKQDN